MQRLRPPAKGRAFLLLLTLAAACSAPPPPPPRVTSKPVRVDRALIRALADYVYAGYDARLAGERPDLPNLSDATLLGDRLALARSGLREALLRAGADPARLDEEGLVSVIHEGVRAGGRYAFLLSSDEGSFALVRVREAEAPRVVALFGAPFPYLRTVYDEALLLDYPAYRGQKLEEPFHRQPAIYRDDGREAGTVCVDLAVARQVGATQFLPAVDALRAQAHRALAGADTAFLALAEPRYLPELLGLARGALRWRSLEQLWSSIRSRSAEEQLERFAADYADRAELRAAAELRELARFREPESGVAEAEGAARVHLIELGALSAMIHGEPLGHVADILALASVALQAPRAEPQFQAARQLVMDLVGRLREGPPGAEADALAFASLARATPDTLRAAARELYDVRAAALDLPRR